MARKTLRLEGVEALEKLFQQLPDRIKTRVMMNAVRAGARIIRNEAKARVPKLTGDLARSITVKTVKKKRRNSFKLIQIGFKKPHSRRAHLTEYGTSTQAAQPFMRPAIDTKGPEAVRVITEKFADGLEKEAAKLAGELGTKKRK